MKFIALFVLCALLVTINGESDANCSNENIRCSQTEFKAYVKCLNANRQKREVCPFANSVQPMIVQPVAVHKPYCEPGCQSAACSRDCTPVPAGNPCHQNCMTSCQGFQCNDRCSTSCQNSPAMIVGQPGSVSNDQRLDTESGGTPNVTTIIRLTNIINNTNVVNVPTSINNTNVNNIDFTGNSTRRNSVHHRENCCRVVQPKICERHSQEDDVFRCIRRQHRTCGEQCVSPIIHAQIRQKCEEGTDKCTSSLAYVPQPTPRCTHTQNWPYVSCRNEQNTNCEGCYDHYGFGFESFHGENQPNCMGCFDDGFDSGPLFRQGPFYRPGHYHTPPCYLTGTCQMNVPTAPMNCGGLGCFGHELIDPVYGMPSISPYSHLGLYSNPQFTFNNANLGVPPIGEFYNNGLIGPQPNPGMLPAPPLYGGYNMNPAMFGYGPPGLLGGNGGHFGEIPNIANGLGYENIERADFGENPFNPYDFINKHLDNTIIFNGTDYLFNNTVIDKNFILQRFPFARFGEKSNDTIPLKKDVESVSLQ